jgi:CelD/BcsL family acetyltransferase involved in cellulose biosynthesis
MSLLESTLPNPNLGQSGWRADRRDDNLLVGLTLKIGDAGKLEQCFGLLRQIDKTTCASVFETEGWLRSAANAALSKSGFEVRFLFALEGARPVAVLPLCLDRRVGLRAARILGAPLSQYTDLICEDGHLGDAIRVFENEIAASNDVDIYIFPRVRGDAKASVLLSALGAERLSESAAPFADLTMFDGFDGYLKANWKAHRDRRRLRRRAAASGPLAFEVCSSFSRAAEVARDAIELKRNWLPPVHRWFGTLASDQWCNALLNAIEFPDHSVQPVVTALHSRSAIAAIEVGFVHKQRYSAFLGAFNPAFRDWSPTELLMEDTVEWCFQNNIGIYDLLPPDDRYKAKWTNRKTPVAHWVLPRTLKGRIYVNILEKKVIPALRRTSSVVQRAIRAIKYRYR